MGWRFICVSRGLELQCTYNEKNRIPDSYILCPSKNMTYELRLFNNEWRLYVT